DPGIDVVLERQVVRQAHVTVLTRLRVRAEAHVQREEHRNEPGQAGDDHERIGSGAPGRAPHPASLRTNIWYRNIEIGTSEITSSTTPSADPKPIRDVSMTVTTETTILIGIIDGKVTCQNVCQALAPSIRAASCREGSTAFSPARYS